MQKRLSLKPEQAEFLSHCKEYGFATQADAVRQALDSLMAEIKAKHRDRELRKQAESLRDLYHKDPDLASLAPLDSEDFT